LRNPNAQGTLRSVMRVWLVLLLCSVSLAACGGAVSRQDAPTVKTVSSDVQQFSTSWTAYINALGSEDMTAARTAVDEMGDSLAAAQDHAIDIDDHELRETFQQYLRTMQRLASVADRIVAYYESPGTADAGAENDLLSEFQAAAEEAQKVDQDVFNQLLERASPDQRDAMRAAYHKAQADFRNATSGAEQ
jgi:hypothetical protein